MGVFFLARRLTMYDSGVVRRPSVPGRKYIAVDLDGTLAHYDKHISRLHIGEPILPMVQRVKGWLRDGHVVIVFTSRVSDPTKHDHEAVLDAIYAWCDHHIGERLSVTAVKQNWFSEIYDDRAFPVEKNTGMLL